MEKKIRVKPGPEGTRVSPATLTDSYRKATEDNTRAWTYERAVEADKELAEAAEQKAPEKLPPAPRPPGARTRDDYRKGATKKTTRKRAPKKASADQQ